MRNLFVIFILYAFVSCTAHRKLVFKNEFKEVIGEFIKNNPIIPNGCKASPIYGITFRDYAGDTLVQFGAFLGKPRLPMLLHPDSSMNNNYEQRKGYDLINNKIVVIFDYAESRGYGLYEPSKLNKNFELTQFNSLPDSCINVLYPGPEIYKIHNGKLIFIEKLDSFHLK